MINTTDEIQELITLLVQKYQPMHILSFGRGHQFKECSSCFAPERQDSHFQHFLFMVTESNVRIEHEVQDFANHHYKQGTAVIVVHGKESVQDAIRANSRFFITVYQHGTVLYWHNGMMVPNPVPADLLEEAAISKAQKYFDHHQHIAEGFLHGARDCTYKRNYNVAMFMLHQVVEQCTAGLIRVFMGYRSERHSLRRQLLLCNCFSPSPAGLFLTGNAEDERLFDILAKAYSQGTYNTSFQVTEADMVRLLQRVSEFVELVKGMCEEKLVELEG